MLEIELKYAIDNKSVAEKIWEDSSLSSMEEPESREKIFMKAAYFDTEDTLLAKNEIAFRVRLEGAKSVASLKWNGQSEGPLHMREEVNVPIDGEACLIMPDPRIFKESEVGRHMVDLVGTAPLSSIMEVGFLRRRLRVDTGKSIIEVSIDVGEIVADGGSLPICELELELFSGDQEDLLALGRQIAEQYDLVPELRSKYARGLSLAGKMPFGRNE